MLCLLHAGWLLLSGAILPTNAQFAQHVAGQLESVGSQPLQQRQHAAGHTRDGLTFIQPRVQETFFQPGIELPKCPYAKVLSTQGVPARWPHMTIEQQAADPVNAAVVQLVSNNRHTVIQMLPFVLDLHAPESVSHQP
jgi:hypothetical protein